MDTNYTLDAFTLRSSSNHDELTGHSKIVLVVDAIKTDQKHVSYQEYLDCDLHNPKEDEDYDDEDPF